MRVLEFVSSTSKVTQDVVATVMQQDVFNLGASQTDTEPLRQKKIFRVWFFFQMSQGFKRLKTHQTHLTLKPNVTAKKTGIKTLSHLLK